MSWFRFYDDALFHPKVVGLRDSEKVFWLHLLCIASRNGGIIPDDLGTIGRLTGSKRATIGRQMGVILASGLVHKEQNCYRVHNWEKRQYKSDVSTSRVRRFREKRNANETFHETDQSRAEQNRVSTVLDSETLSEPQKKLKLTFDETFHPGRKDENLAGGGYAANGRSRKPEKRDEMEGEFAIWWKTYPRREAKGQARKAYAAARKKASAEALLAAAQRAATLYASTEQKFIPFPATWLNGERWLDETASRDPPANAYTTGRSI